MSSDELESEWMASGDRSDPALQMIDNELVPTLTYDGYRDDVKELEAAFFSGDMKYDFVQIHFKIKEKQKMHEGDRSHENLQRLDRLRSTLTYDGWEDDYRRAEDDHLESGCTDHQFRRALARLERKQSIHDGDRSAEELIRLDSLVLSYSGWEEDIDEAVDDYTNDWLNLEASVNEMQERQRIHDGDRSSARLVALDQLELSYPGHEEDITEAEERHCKGGGNFEILLINMKRKQLDFEGTPADISTYHPIQKQIMERMWTFEGWAEELEKVRMTEYINLLHNDLKMFEIRQMIHDGNYTDHQDLVKLRNVQLQLSYPKSEEDIEECKRFLSSQFGYCNHMFGDRLSGMMNKQKTYEGHLRNQLNMAQECEDRGLGDCNLCWESPRTHAFVPCGHVCACLACSRKVMNSRKECPICNRRVTMAMELFLP